MVEKQEWQKYMRWHFYIILLIIHGLLYIDYLHILYYLNLQLWNMNSEAAAGLFLKILQSLFTKLQAFRSATLWPATLLKRHSYTGVFPWNLINSQKHLFWRTSVNDCFCVLITSSYIDFYNSLQYTFLIFTNRFFIKQLKQEN